MGFRLRRNSLSAVKNPVFTLAQRACATLGDTAVAEAAILNLRKSKQEQEEQQEPPVNADKDDDDTNDGSKPLTPTPTTNVVIGGSELTPGKTVGNNENRPLGGITTTARRPNYEEIAKVKPTRLSPRPPLKDENGIARAAPVTSSPLPLKTSPLLPLRDDVGKPLISPTPPSATSPTSFLPKLSTSKKTLPSLPPGSKSMQSGTEQNTKSLPPPNKHISPPHKQEYPGAERMPLTTQENVYDAINEARQTSNYDVMIEFFAKMYSSFHEVLSVVSTKGKSGTSSLKLNFDYLDHLHESMIRMPKEVRKAILRSIINCMLQDHRGKKSSDDLVGFLVFLLNPLFSDSSTYVIYAHVLRQIATFDQTEQQQFIAWLKTLPVKDFQGTVNRLRTFVNYRLFPTKNDIPEGEKSGWWIPNGVKVLALLNAANDQCVPSLVPRKIFYVKAIEVLDLIREYHLWESGSQAFSFCQYPFVLPLSAKRLIIQKDSETKMLLEARQSLLYKFRQKQIPNMGLLFLNLRIRRKFLLEDSLREISRNQGDLKKKLRVIFTGEPGIDLGGVSKEWFFLITQRFFNEDYGMFTYNTKTRQWWFSMSCKENNQEYNLCGVLLGLAMYNGINLDIRFPMAVYKKLLSPAIVPYNNPHQPVGITKFQIEDFIDVFPDLGNGLKQLREYDGDVEEDLCQSFMISFTEFGQVLTRYLRPDGDKIPVTNENREEYIGLYVNYMMNKSIYKQFYSFYHGFHSVCASNALLLLRPEEVETLVIGDPDFNMSDLEKITVYDGFSRSDGTIRHFWEAVHDFNTNMKKKFLRFCTGNDRIPVGGMKEMKFKITRVSGSNSTQMLPTAHTCFNQLCLPPYKSRKLLLRKLCIAVENAEGFGLE